MRIGFVHNTFKRWPIGGAERSLEYRAKKLAEKGHEVSILTVSADGSDHIDDEDGYRVYYCGLPWSTCSPYFKDRTLKARLRWHLEPSFRNALVKHPYFASFVSSVDIVNTVNLPGISPRILSEFATAKLPVVQTVADYYFLCPRLTKFRNSKSCDGVCADCRLTTHARRRSGRTLAGVVYISEYMKQVFEQQRVFSSIASCVIPNSYDFSSSHWPPVRQEGPLRLGYIGQLSEAKGVQRLVETFSKIREVDCSLRISGTGVPEIEAWCARRKELDGRIILAGWEDVASFYMNVDVVIVPSMWEEPLSRVPFEANSFNVPALVSSRGGIPELISPGENGHVFDIENEQELIEHVVTLARNQSRLLALKDSCRKYAATRFSHERIAGLYEGFLGEFART